MLAPVGIPDAVKKSVDDEDERVGAGQRRVEDEQQKVLPLQIVRCAPRVSPCEKKKKSEVSQENERRCKTEPHQSLTL